MTLKEFMAVEGFRFNKFTWVRVKCDNIVFSIGEDYIIGSVDEDEIKEKYYPRTIRSITLGELEIVNEVLYYEYQIELYWVLFYNLDVVRLIEGIDKNILICYTLDTVKKGKYYMKTLYQTKDGRTFSDEKTALDWEKSLEVKKEYEIKVRALGYITDTIEAETEEEARKKIKEYISEGFYEGDFDISYEISCIKRI